MAGSSQSRRQVSPLASNVGNGPPSLYNTTDKTLNFAESMQYFSLSLPLSPPLALVRFDHLLPPDRNACFERHSHWPMAYAFKTNKYCYVTRVLS